MSCKPKFITKTEVPQIFRKPNVCSILRLYRISIVHYRMSLQATQSHQSNLLHLNTDASIKAKAILEIRISGWEFLKPLPLRPLHWQHVFSCVSLWLVFALQEEEEKKRKIPRVNFLISMNASFKLLAQLLLKLWCAVYVVRYFNNWEKRLLKISLVNYW